MKNDDNCSYAESEQRDMIHFLEGVSPNVIDESTGIPLKQEDMLVKLYARANSDEVKNPQILRFILFYVFISSPPVILEKTVLYLIHNCLKFANCQDERLKYIFQLLFHVKQSGSYLLCSIRVYS